ncbi:MAG: hypothetical protein OEZ38_06625 [Gammaproteobacteria bacterium]|nr:hypothetical protein [Gammaproteobacteria bacterium]
MKKMKIVLISMVLMLSGVNALAADKFAGSFEMPMVLPPGMMFPITGVIDRSTNMISVDEFIFFGMPVTTLVGELLPPGMHTRTYSSIFYGNQTRTETIPENTVGAYIVFEWNGIPFQLFMAWSLSPDGLSYTNVSIPGNTIIGGPFHGITAFIEFNVEKTGAFVEMAVNVEGGNTQECNQVSGREITINAMPQLYGDAVLDAITWEVNGESAGTGMSISEFFTVGSHIVNATATLTNGDSDTASVSVQVRDTTRPELKIAFVNYSGDEIESSSAGPVGISIKASDICDPDPVVRYGNATKVYRVNDGDVVFVNQGASNLNLPATAIRVDASASDAYGNAISAAKTLNIE